MTNMENWNGQQVSFKPLDESDLVLMHKWLNDPYINVIWSHGTPISMEEVREKYMQRISGTVPVVCYIINYEDVSVGYVQSYLWKDFTGDAAYLEKEELDSGSLDIFIGDPAYRNRGLGTLFMRLFLRKLFFPNYGVKSCIITPHVDNVPALKAYGKAGFTKLRVENDPNEPWSPVMLMMIGKESL